MVIRADATTKIGAGHVMRCLALASEWRRRGGEVALIGAVDAPEVRQRVQVNVDQFLPVDESAGAALEKLQSLNVSSCWIVVDGYHFEDSMLEDYENSGYAVLVVQDGQRVQRVPATAVLAPDVRDLELNRDSFYGRQVFAGPRFRPLRAEFCQARKRRKIDCASASVLVGFGGADSKNTTARVLEALKVVLRKNDKLFVVLGALNMHEDSVRKALLKLRCKCEVLRDVDNMASLYDLSDVAVSASGGAAWEMAAMGVPSLLIPVAANQIATAKFLEGAGAAVLVDSSEVKEDGELAEKLLEIMTSEELALNMSRAGPKAVDAKGAVRVCDALLSNAVLG
ncbi:MAG: UDP-2,4-diacetamido-2,4,6-trideoxy-beta-L-altropyranose hydrolase [Rhizobiaceae bacterium]